MALRCVFQRVPTSLQVFKKWSTYNNQLFKFGTAVRDTDSHHTFAGFARLTSNDCGIQRQSRSNTQNLHMICARNFTMSSVRNEREKQHGRDHTKLWSLERLVAAGMLGIIPAAIIFPSQPMDCLLAVSLAAHSHWGIEAIVVDYVRPIIFGKLIPVIAHGLVYVLSIATLTGLLFLIFNDCGLANAIHLLWKL